MLFYFIFLLYDIIYYFIYPAMNINEAQVGWPEGGLGIGVYIFVGSLLPISIYLQKRDHTYFVKYLFFIGYMLIDLINNLMIYLRTDRVFENGNIVEIFFILFAPVFANRKYFCLVSFGAIGKYVFFALLLWDLKVVIPLVLCIFFFIISRSLLKRFQSYVSTVVKALTNIKQTENLVLIGKISTAIGHEIRNPLTALKGFTQIQKDRNPTDVVSYDIMLQEIERINGIVSELMLFGKPKPITYQLCDMQKILLYVVQLMESYAMQYAVNIHIQTDEPLPHINGDEKQLKQVLLNLMKNGIESMMNGGNLNVHAYKTGEGHLCICIQDEGCGMDREKIKKIGEAFYTTKENGTGLGLMITYKIIEEHQGDIKIESNVGVGTKVEIILPII
ncbi:ATP-binding protein [Bacillus sp. DX1.1]|nr:MULTISPECIES: ATP-binding protein [unclassified Bacillus (in: firmicutes)]MDM5153191.1 ATP-binding protein [Bacillus sp. DX1.1]WJE83986.1 ATP-binding protein [Bacillus sp. DX3.1]